MENSHNTWSNREIDEPHEDEVVSTGIREVLKEEGATFLSPEFIRRVLCPESTELGIGGPNVLNGPDYGGEGGIRTPGARKGSLAFEASAIDHSATSPHCFDLLIRL